MGMPQGHYPNWPPPPPGYGTKKASVWPKVLLGLGLAIALVVVAGYVGLAQRDDKQGTAVASAAADTRYPESARASDPSEVIPAPGATAPVVVPTPAPRPTPAPPPGPQPVYKTGENPVMANVGLATGGCQLPEWSRFEAGVRAFLTAMVDCLDRKWQPVMAQLGLPWHRPEVDITLEVKQHDCIGLVDNHNSQLCQDKMFLVPESYLKNSIGMNNSAVVAAAMVAHEYGHQIQSLSGVLGAYGQQRNTAGSNSAAGLELSRRLELQAQCLAGVFMGATFDGPTLQLAQTEEQHRGDYAGNGKFADHGQPESNGAWFGQGVRTNQLAQCNTFLADPSAVR